MEGTWKRSGQYQDIIYETWDGIAKITINRPEVRNAFRPVTVSEMSKAFEAARDDPTIGVVILTGAGTEAFCSGGDQRIRCLLYTSPSPRDLSTSRMPSSA